jgi:DinB superfamily
MNGAKRAVQLLLALGCCIFSHSEQAADEGKISVDQRAKVIKLLKDSQAETLEALEKLSDAQLKFKPAPERWSVLECAEHIMLSEELPRRKARPSISKTCWPVARAKRKRPKALSPAASCRGNR